MSVTPESVQPLLDSQDFGDRLRGVNQLRQLEPAVAFAMIQPLLTDNNVRVRYAAVSQIASLGAQNPTLALDLLRDRLLNDPEADVQAAAADSLGALKLTAAFEDLQDVYHNTSEWLVRFSIIAALGELGDPRSLPMLEDALNSDSDLVQTAAIGSLGELGDERAITLLAPYTSHADWQIRYRVVLALGHLGGPEAAQVLQTLTQDPVEQIAQQAVALLATQ